MSRTPYSWLVVVGMISLCIGLSGCGKNVEQTPGRISAHKVSIIPILFNNWFRDLAVNKLAAGAVLMGLVLFVLIMVFQKLFDRETS